MNDEFVGVKKTYSIECFDGEDWYTVNRTHPEFPAALAALSAAARWLYQRQVDRTPASIPFPVRAWTGYCAGGNWYDD